MCVVLCGLVSPPQPHLNTCKIHTKWVDVGGLAWENVLFLHSDSYAKGCPD